MTDEILPHTFDLCFDLKTREDLVRHYAALRSELAHIEGIMKGHGMEFTVEELAVISPEADGPADASPRQF
jgi:hypothetical protein